MTLVARVEGYLDKIHFTDGAQVKKGDLLFTIQQQQYKAQLQQALAQVAAQKAALLACQAPSWRDIRASEERMPLPRPKSITGITSGRPRAAGVRPRRRSVFPS